MTTFDSYGFSSEIFLIAATLNKSLKNLYI